MKPKGAAVVAAGMLGLVSAGITLVSLVRRRRSTGQARIAGSLHLNARWWNDQSAQEGELLYVALGDSAAQGVGASRPGRSYVGLVADRLRARSGYTVRVVNLSSSGARLRDAIATQLPLLQGLSPDIITVAIGANDIANFDRARFEYELEDLYAVLPAGSIVADIPAFYIGSAERNARQANTIVYSLAAAHGLSVAPLHRTTLRQGVARYAFNQVAADFFHPNDRGYRVWASAFFPLIDRMRFDTERLLPPRGSE